VRLRHVHLLDFVSDDHDEPRDRAVDDCHRGVVDALGGAGSKRFVGSDLGERVWDAALVTVAPAVAPDLGDDRNVSTGGAANRYQCHPRSSRILRSKLIARGSTIRHTEAIH
jgi:hypothetical protein